MSAEPLPSVPAEPLPTASDDAPTGRRVFRARTDSGDPDPVDIHVGTRLRLRRMLLGMSQTDLANALSLSFQQVQKYESGANRIGCSRLFRLSQALDVPVGFFFDDMNPGLAESQSNFVASESGREGLELMRNYHRITDPAIRRSVYDLAKSLAAHLNGDEG